MGRARRARHPRARHRAARDRGRPLDWIQIGSVAGPDLTLPSAALRAANLRILGSGQGSVSTAAIVAELPALAAEIAAGAFTVDAAPAPAERGRDGLGRAGRAGPARRVHAVTPPITAATTSWTSVRDGESWRPANSRCAAPIKVGASVLMSAPAAMRPRSRSATR